MTRKTKWGKDRPLRNKHDGACSRCDKPRDRKGRYCAACHAAYQREWRKGREETPEQKEQAKARYRRYYDSKGRVKRAARYKKEKDNA